MIDSFSTYHPITNFLYFGVVLTCAMFFMHPVFLIISFVCAFTYSAYLKGKRTLKLGLLYLLPLMLVTALLNPAFNHEGATILAYLRSGNPLTLESIIYGVAAAMVLVTVICWFSCFNEIMTSDKLIYLLGRIIPALSLVLSMALRLIPRFKAQIKIISNAQRCVGRDVSTGSVLQRAGQGIKILSIMVTWVLENAIETADSMKSRGYGLKGRTAFSIYHFDRRDVSVLVFLLLCGIYIVIGAITGGLYYRYFPTVRAVWDSFYAVSLFSVYFVMCIAPVAINVKEDVKWKVMQSGI